MIGVDISASLIQKARELCSRHRLDNVQLGVVDCGVEWERGPKQSPLLAPGSFGFVVCANVMISPEPLTRRAILSNMSQVRGACLLFQCKHCEEGVVGREGHIDVTVLVLLEGAFGRRVHHAISP